MITLRNISKAYGAQDLLNDVSLQINDRDRYALVGPNGAGKSTLFKLILGKEEPDSGEVSLRSGVRFGYLAQETASLSGKTVIEETCGNDIDNRGEAKAKKILMGLGFKVTDFDRPAKEMSGGWQMRIMIARLLLDEPDLLMLDEPTNHLDLESLLWFQNYLNEYRGAIFIISHDRDFINAITERIIEVRNHQLHIYNGSFEDYLRQKKEEEENLLEAYKRQQKEIKEIEKYITRFRAKAALASNVQSKIKYLEKMERIEIPPEDKTVGFSFPQPHRSGVNALELKEIKHSYDGKRMIYDGLNLTLERGQRIVLVGPNGAGKSTLLKLLAGNLEFQSGERKVGFNTEVGYFSQHRTDMFTEGRTAYEEAADTRRAHSETTIRTVLGSFLFRGPAADKSIDVLSGGEKSRLGLAKLLLDPPNLLLMDEPTTHLDMASVETLSKALSQFEGTICFISHDIYFIRRLANNVIHVNDGKTTLYPGDYDYFLHRMAQQDGEEAALFRAEEELENRKKGIKPEKKAKKKDKSKKSGGKKSKEQKRREAEERNAKYRAAKEAEKLKEEEKEITDQLADPETHKNPELAKKLTLRLREIQKKNT